jgi:RNA polymerase sigma factor (sigma-70 family)
MTLEQILHEQAGPLTRRLQRIVRSPEAAEDLRQEAFARAWAHAPRDASPDHQRAWLHRTGTNLALDELRRRRLRDHAPLDEIATDFGAPEPGEQIAAREALAALTPHERLVLVLRFHAGLSLRDVGALLDVSEDAARKRVARARKRFAATLNAGRAPLVLFVAGDEPTEGYVAWLTSAGARVRVVERTGKSAPLAQLAGVDGVVFGGSGRDLHPALYREEVRASCRAGDLRRDREDGALLRVALAQDLPLIGICRGHQLLNVVLGGTLHQDLTEDGVHRADQHFVRHDVVAREGSIVRRVTGRRAPVASDHHQGIRRLGRGLHVTAQSDCGLPEAVEVPGRRFAVGVQWHAEREASGAAGGRVAEAFVAALAA